MAGTVRVRTVRCHKGHMEVRIESSDHCRRTGQQTVEEEAANARLDEVASKARQTKP